MQELNTSDRNLKVDNSGETIPNEVKSDRSCGVVEEVVFICLPQSPQLPHRGI
jgi:hypothetical protein